MSTKSVYVYCICLSDLLDLVFFFVEDIHFLTPMMMLGINLNIKRLLVGENWLKTIRAPDGEGEEAENRAKPSLCDDAFFLSQVANQECCFSSHSHAFACIYYWSHKNFANQGSLRVRASKMKALL